MNPALLVIDLQEHFFEETPRLLETELLPNVERLLLSARQIDIPIIHVVTIYKADQSNWPTVWREQGEIWCLEGTRGSRIRPEAKPAQGELVVEKSRFSAFHDTTLNDILSRQGIDTLIIAGYSCDVCLRFTTMDAYNRGYRTFIVEDATESMRETRQQSLEYLWWLTRTESVRIDDLARITATPLSQLQPGPSPQRPLTRDLGL